MNRALRILLATNSVILVAGAMLGPIYALFVGDVGGDLLDASIAGAVFAVAAGITTLVSGNFADRVRRDELILVFGYLVIGLGFFLFGFVNSIYSLLAVQVFIGFGEAVYSPAFDALYSKHLTVKKAGRQWGTWESMNYFATALGAIIGGIIVSVFGFRTLFFSMSGLCFLSALYVWLVPKRVF